MCGKRLEKLKRSINGRQEGITGLETAIVLIAFVMVASVFAYVVVSAGLFSSQKTKETIQAGVQEGQGTIEIKGNMMAMMEQITVDGNTTWALDKLLITVGAVPGSEPVDFTDTTDASKNRVVIAYSDDKQVIPKVQWTMVKLTSIGDDNMLDVGELFELTLDIGNATTANRVGPYDEFTVEIKPPGGAVMQFDRSLPPRCDTVVNLY